MDSQGKAKVALTFALYQGDQLVRRDTIAQDIVKVGKDPAQPPARRRRARVAHARGHRGGLAGRHHADRSGQRARDAGERPARQQVQDPPRRPDPDRVDAHRARDGRARDGRCGRSGPRCLRLRLPSRSRRPSPRRPRPQPAAHRGPTPSPARTRSLPLPPPPPIPSRGEPVRRSVVRPGRREPVRRSVRTVRLSGRCGRSAA